jgi:hypothetical protein
VLLRVTDARFQEQNEGISSKRGQCGPFNTRHQRVSQSRSANHFRAVIRARVGVHSSNNYKSKYCEEYKPNTIAEKVDRKHTSNLG